MNKLQSAKFLAAGVVLSVLGASGIVTAQNAREAPVRIHRALQQNPGEKPTAIVPRLIVQKEPAPAAPDAADDPG